MTLFTKCGVGLLGREGSPFRGVGIPGQVPNLSLHLGCNLGYVTKAWVKQSRFVGVNQGRQANRFRLDVRRPLSSVSPLWICACSSTDRASDYGSEGLGFESLQARSETKSPSLLGLLC